MLPIWNGSDIRIALFLLARKLMNDFVKRQQAFTQDKCVICPCIFFSTKVVFLTSVFPRVRPFLTHSASDIVLRIMYHRSFSCLCHWEQQFYGSFLFAWELARLIQGLIIVFQAFTVDSTLLFLWRDFPTLIL